MSKKRRKLVRVNERRRPPWGATKATAKVLAKEREFQNRMHVLQAEIVQRDAVIGNLVTARDQLRRKLDAVCMPTHINALRIVCKMPVLAAHDLGLRDAVTNLCVWLDQLDGGVIENVRQTLSATDFEVKTSPNAPPLMPLPSGITKVRADHDDDTSVDDLFAKAVDVHLERMDRRYYWIGIQPIGGEMVHIDITQRKNEPIRARVRK